MGLHRQILPQLLVFLHKHIIHALLKVLHRRRRGRWILPNLLVMLYL